VNALLEIISDTLKKGDSLTLPGFGTLEVRERMAQTARNPKTGAELKIAASRVAAFKPVQRPRPRSMEAGSRERSRT